MSYPLTIKHQKAESINTPTPINKKPRTKNEVVSYQQNMSVKFRLRNILEIQDQGEIANHS